MDSGFTAVAIASMNTGDESHGCVHARRSNKLHPCLVGVKCLATLAGRRKQSLHR